MFKLLVQLLYKNNEVISNGEKRAVIYLHLAKNVSLTKNLPLIVQVRLEGVQVILITVLDILQAYLLALDQKDYRKWR